MTKLTVEDLVKAQQDTITRLDFIANRIDAIANSRRPVETSSAVTFIWLAFGTGAFLLAQTNPLFQQAFNGLCLLVLTSVMIAKTQGKSALQEDVDRKHYEAGVKKLKESLRNSIGLNEKTPG